MMNYNYRAAMYNDILNYMVENVDINEYLEDGELDTNTLYEDMNDTMWTADSVTGNASGSYTFNAFKAAEYVSGNNDILIEALEEFGDSAESYKRAIQSPEYADVTIRCYLLGEVLSQVIDDINDMIEQATAEAQEQYNDWVMSEIAKSLDTAI